MFTYIYVVILKLILSFKMEDIDLFTISNQSTEAMLDYLKQKGAIMNKPPI